MKVSHAGQEVQAVVVSGEQSAAYGMSDTAEFMLTLADGLYSNKYLAAVREVLCNAWDAHILAGRKDRPIIVTLTEDMLTIRDNGPGIPFDKITDVYCVYGKSTKVYSDEETGGFGLGSKAPFAITDQFTVMNARDGKRVTYSAIKSDSTKGGRPSFTPLVTVDSVYEGVEVQIPISRDNYEKVSLYIREIAFWADMNVSFNGTVLDTLGTDNLPEGQNWIMPTRHSQAFGSGSKGDYTPVVVRIGSVLYPVQSHERYEKMYHQVHRLVQHLPEITHLLLMAPPSKIAVTPQRESLSMTDLSVEAIHDLLFEFCTEFDAVLQQNAYKTADRLIEKARKQGLRELFITYDGGKIPLAETLKGNLDGGFLSSTIQVVFMALAFQTPTLPGFRQWLQRRKLGVLRNTPAFHTGWKSDVFRVIAKHYLGTDGSNASRAKAQAYYRKTVLNPILKKIAKSEHLRKSDLRQFTDLYSHQMNSGNPNIEDFKVPVAVTDIINSMRNVVILTPVKNNICRRLSDAPADWLPKLLGQKAGYSHNEEVALSRILFYHTSRNQKKLDEARAMFKSLGYVILDMHEKFDWEPEEEQEAEEVVRVKKLAGLPCWRASPGLFAKNSPKKDDFEAIDRIINPKAIVAMSDYGHLSGGLAHMDAIRLAAIRKRFGHEVALARQMNTHNAQVKRGVLPIREYLLQKILQEFETNESLRSVFWLIYQGEGQKLDSWHSTSQLFRLAASDSYLSKLFIGRQFKPTQDHQFWADLWAHFAHRQKCEDFSPKEKDLCKKIAASMRDMPYGAAHAHALNRMEEFPILGLLDTHKVLEALTLTKGNKQTQKRRDAYLFSLKTRLFLKYLLSKG